MAQHHAVVILFDALNLLSVLLFVLTLLPAVFSRSVQRTAGWYNLMAAWLLCPLSFSLIIGNQERQGEPPFWLCSVQAISIYAIPALAIASLLSYYIEFYLIISSSRSGNLTKDTSPRSIWLIITPWIVFLVVLIETLGYIFYKDNISLVQLADNDLYCRIDSNIPSLVASTINACSILLIIGLEVRTGFIMYRNWPTFRRLCQNDHRVFLTIYVRFICCTLSALIAFALSARTFVLPDPDTGILAIIYPFISIFIALAFGTQKDIVKAWAPRRRREPYRSIIFRRPTVVTSTNSPSSDQNALTISSMTTEESLGRGQSPC